MKHSLVAILIPTYNRKDLVLETVAAVLKLVCPPGWDYRVVVIDDGSQDGTYDTLCSAFANHPKVQILTKENGERGAARNFGAAWAIQNYRPDWLLFHDSDDVIFPSALEHFVERIARSPQAVAAYGRIELWYPSTGKISKTTTRFFPEGDLSKAVLRKPILCLGVTFVRTPLYQSLGGFSENREMSGSEDWAFLVRVALSGTVVHIPHAMLLYRRHAGNTDLRRTLISIKLAMKEMEPYFKQYRANAVKSLSRFGLLLQIGTLTSHSQTQEAAALLVHSVSKDFGLLFDTRCQRLILSLVKRAALSTFTNIQNLWRNRRLKRVNT